MIDFFNLQELLKKNKENQNSEINHVLINLFPLKSNEENKKNDFENLMNLFDNLIDLQIEYKIPVFTISLGKKEDIDEEILEKYQEKLLERAKKFNINITIFGRWYDFSGFLVEALKVLNNATKDFDKFFLNICLNYDPKQEIADACRVIIRKVYDEKLDFDSITPDLIKENIYSSYFMQPDVIIEPSNKFSGTFLWDSVNSKIVFLNKELQKITKEDIQKAISEKI
ncbi:MAG: undecaprenyl diphosphate synthase family protein [Candidatus Woesearchaeota archaeon]